MFKRIIVVLTLLVALCATGAYATDGGDTYTQNGAIHHNTLTLGGQGGSSDVNNRNDNDNRNTNINTALGGPTSTT